MEVIPVLDVLDGVVVRGIGGRRDEYRPIQSLLTADPAPLSVLEALVDTFRFQTVYVADLDGLNAGRPNRKLIADLLQNPLQFIIDAGAATAEQAIVIADLGAQRVVIASESLRSPTEMRKLIDRLGAERVVFSMDMKRGRPIAVAPEWSEMEPDEIVCQAAHLGATQFILLDLADVGEGAGTSTLPLLQRLRVRLPNCWFAVGGGMRNQSDLDAAQLAGAEAVLIASALHDGRYPFARNRSHGN